MAAADTLLVHGEWKAARKLYDKVIATDTAPTIAYVRRSFCNYKTGAEWDVVFADLNEALRREPHHFESLINRGERYLDNLMFERAIEDMTEALRYASDTTGLVLCYSLRGVAYCAIRAFDAAANDLNLALELDSMYHAVYAELAHVLHELGRHEEALRMLIRYTELVPEHYVGYMNVGFCLAQAERYKEALDWYDKAEDRAGKDLALVLNNRGYAKYKLGDHQGSLKDIRKSLELMSWNSYAYRNLALVFIAQGKNDDACTALEDALKWGFTKQWGQEVQQLYNEHCK